MHQTRCQESPEAGSVASCGSPSMSSAPMPGQSPSGRPRSPRRGCIVVAASSLRRQTCRTRGSTHTHSVRMDRHAAEPAGVTSQAPAMISPAMGTSAAARRSGLTHWPPATAGHYRASALLALPVSLAVDAMLIGPALDQAGRAPRRHRRHPAPHTRCRRSRASSRSVSRSVSRGHRCLGGSIRAPMPR